MTHTVPRAGVKRRQKSAFLLGDRIWIITQQLGYPNSVDVGVPGNRPLLGCRSPENGDQPNAGFDLAADEPRSLGVEPCPEMDPAAVDPTLPAVAAMPLRPGVAIAALRNAGLAPFPAMAAAATFHCRLHQRRWTRKLYEQLWAREGRNLEKIWRQTHARARDPRGRRFLGATLLNARCGGRRLLDHRARLVAW
jgi:hypothetical protein